MQNILVNKMKQQRYKALFFVNSLSGGGAEKVVLNLAEEFHKNNVDSVIVTLFSSEKLNLPKYIEEWNLNMKATTIKFSSYIRLLKLKNDLAHNKIWWQFLQTYNNYKFQCITAHLMTSKLVALNSPYKNSTVYVNHTSSRIFNNIEWFIYKKYIDKLYANKKQVFVSHDLTNAYIKNCSPKKEFIKTIYNPIIVNKLRLSNLHNRPYIIFVGRLEKNKGPIKILNLYKQGCFNKKVDLIFLGTGSLKEQLTKKIKHLNLENSVFLKGYVDNPQDWISQAILLASTSKYEALPTTIIEALLLNTPVISYDCPYGPSEILIDELSKYLIPLEASDEIYIEKMRSIMEGKYPKIPQKIHLMFNPKKILREYINFYNE